MTASAPPVLVFGDDGAAASDRAWGWITAQPWPGWRLDVLTADPDAKDIKWGEPPKLEPWTPTWDRDAAPLADVDVRFLTATSDPRALLADVDADVLVVGTKGTGGLGAAFSGSTTEWLLHHPPAPLVIARRTERVRSILVCADGSPHARRATETVAVAPLAADCDVTVLTVDDGRSDTAAAGQQVMEVLDGRVGGLRREERAGRPTDVILDIAPDFDLVVMGTRGLTGWRRLRLGSTASAVARSHGGDVLVACVEDDATT